MNGSNLDEQDLRIFGRHEGLLRRRTPSEWQDLPDLIKNGLTAGLMIGGASRLNHVSGYAHSAWQTHSRNSLMTLGAAQLHTAVRVEIERRTKLCLVLAVEPDRRVATSISTVQYARQHSHPVVPRDIRDSR